MRVWKPEDDQMIENDCFLQHIFSQIYLTILYVRPFHCVIRYVKF